MMTVLSAVAKSFVAVVSGTIAFVTHAVKASREYLMRTEFVDRL